MPVLKKLSGSFVVFDIETSGFNPELHKIIEIAAIKVIDGVRVDTYQSLVKYNGNLSPNVVELTGINSNDLKYAPDRERVLKEFREFVGNYDLVGHNVAQFDNKFLWFSALSVGIEPMRNGVVDTLSIARQTVQSDSYKLEYLCRALGVAVSNTHRALDDANLTLSLLERLSQQFNISMQPEFFEYQGVSKFGQRVNASSIARNGNVDHPDIAGKVFCVTTFQPFASFNTEADLQQFIVDAGGQVANNVTRKTDYLIDCDPVYVSGKEKKVLDYVERGKAATQIIAPSEFLALANLQ